MDVGQMTEKESEYDSLLRRYIEICNEAIEKNGDKFPYSAIWGAALPQVEGKQLAFALRDDRPKARLRVAVDGAHLDAANEGETCQDVDWVFDYSHLKDVIENADACINEPTRLDWSWLRSVTPET